MKTELNASIVANARRIIKRARVAENKTMTEKTRKAALKLVGKCFVHQNGGGGAHWPWYVRVLAVKSVYTYVATLWAESIQASSEDLYGIEVRRDGRLDAYYGALDPDYVLITEDEYKQKTDVILAMLGLTRKGAP